jgi:hypothetical protein
MPQFTPPTTPVKGDGDILLARYHADWGESVVKQNGHYVLDPYPWLGDLRVRPVNTDSYSSELVEGVDWFQGGRTYVVSSAVAAQLNADGFTTT